MMESAAYQALKSNVTGPKVAVPIAIPAVATAKRPNCRYKTTINANWTRPDRIKASRFSAGNVASGIVQITQYAIAASHSRRVTRKNTKIMKNPLSVGSTEYKTT